MTLFQGGIKLPAWPKISPIDGISSAEASRTRARTGSRLGVWCSTNWATGRTSRRKHPDFEHCRDLWSTVGTEANWHDLVTPTVSMIRPARPWFVLRGPDSSCGALARPVRSWSVLRGPGSSREVLIRPTVPWFAPRVLDPSHRALWFVLQGPDLSCGPWFVTRRPGPCDEGGLFCFANESGFRLGTGQTPAKP